MTADEPDAGTRNPSRDRPRRGRTVVELRARPDGTWVATQVGVDVEGRGPSAPLAVAAYCEALAETDP